MKVWSLQRPHHLSFHLNWLSFFVSFFATFAPAALLVVIRDDVNLTRTDLGAASISSLLGSIFSRIVVGSVCDSYGPRYAHAFLQLLCSCATLGMAIVLSSEGFIICRLVIGFSLATFVSCQFWCTVLFSVRIVGTVNAVAAGWGNAGAGLAHLLLPFLYLAFTHSVSDFVAWRLCFIVCALGQVLIGTLVLLFGQDLPEGNYRELRKEGHIGTPRPWMQLQAAVCNYRTWILTMSYGLSFGVELTVDNIIVQYLFDQFDLDLHLAGVFGSIFALSNIFARALGGLASDHFAKNSGMKGRLWTLYVLQSLGGCISILMFFASGSLGLTMAVVSLWSILIPMACGGCYSIVPFVSRRGLGGVSGIVAAGGSIGGAVSQALFFTPQFMTDEEGFLWMGVMIICGSSLLFLMRFPMWGGMLYPHEGGQTEETYYSLDYTLEERSLGMHREVLRFATESRSQRGLRRTLLELGLTLKDAIP